MLISYLVHNNIQVVLHWTLSFAKNLWGDILVLIISLKAASVAHFCPTGIAIHLHGVSLLLDGRVILIVPVVLPFMCDKHVCLKYLKST